MVQEIDVATGRVVFEWHSLDHVGFEESYALPPTLPFDYFHVNSIAVDHADGNLLVSARNTWALYKVERHTGAVLWRLGGKRSDFSLGPDARFAWQHDARRLADGRITLFDDEDSPAEASQSRAIVLAVDEPGRTVRLIRQLTHPDHLLVANQGSMRLLPGGAAAVGWGAQPYYSEFDEQGRLVFDGRLPAHDQSYRAIPVSWDGHPTRPPDVTLQRSAAGTGHVTLYVSWNGATAVRSWRVLGGADRERLLPVATRPVAGFETPLEVVARDHYVVAALDAAGHELARSRVVSA